MKLIRNPNQARAPSILKKLFEMRWLSRIVHLSHRRLSPKWFTLPLCHICMYA